MAIEAIAANPVASVALFLAAALAEIGGGYLVWLWIREKKIIALGALGGIILFVYGIIPTLQPADFGRVYAAYVVFSLSLQLCGVGLWTKRSQIDMK